MAEFYVDQFKNIIIVITITILFFCDKTFGSKVCGEQWECKEMDPDFYCDPVINMCDSCTDRCETGKPECKLYCEGMYHIFSMNFHMVFLIKKM